MAMSDDPVAQRQQGQQGQQAQQGEALPLPADLVVLRPEGLYCPAGDFYIDPWRPVADRKSVV